KISVKPIGSKMLALSHLPPTAGGCAPEAGECLSGMVESLSFWPRNGDVMSSIARGPMPRNEPVLSYVPGSAERRELKSALDRMAGERIEIPVVIGGREIRTGD